MSAAEVVKRLEDLSDRLHYHAGVLVDLLLDKEEGANEVTVDAGELDDAATNILFAVADLETLATGLWDQHLDEQADELRKATAW